MKLFKSLLLSTSIALTTSAFATSEIPEGFESHIYTSGDRNFEVVQEESNDGQEVVILMHGWPQDWTEWKHVMPTLANDYHVVAMNLRGIGKTSPTESAYTKTELAADAVAVLDLVGAEKAHFVGHDIGGMTSFVIASDFADKAHSVTMVDVPLPGFQHFEIIAKDPRAWHFGFHATPNLPEAVVGDNVEEYIGHFINSLSFNKEAISQEEVEYFASVYQKPTTLKSGFEFYRAFAADAEHNKTVSLENSPKILVVGGQYSMGGLGEMIAGELMGKGAKDVKQVTIPNSGHWVPEENPAELSKTLLAFFK